MGESLDRDRVESSSPAGGCLSPRPMGSQVVGATGSLGSLLEVSTACARNNFAIGAHIAKCAAQSARKTAAAFIAPKLCWWVTYECVGISAGGAVAADRFEAVESLQPVFGIRKEMAGREKLNTR